MQACRTMGALASVMLLWAGVVSASAASTSVMYRCQSDEASYRQQVSVGQSRQVSLRSHGQLQETAPGSTNEPLAQAAFQANGLSVNCQPLSSTEAAREQRSWPDGTQIARVNFSFDQAGLSDAARATLAAMAPEIRDSNQLFILEGHTDSQGEVDYNLLLGQNRAESVAEFLTARGVAAERLVIRSQGKMSPVNNSRNSAEQAQNRRVEIIVRSLRQGV